MGSEVCGKNKTDHVGYIEGVQSSQLLNAHQLSIGYPFFWKRVENPSLGCSVSLFDRSGKSDRRGTTTCVQRIRRFIAVDRIVTSSADHFTRALRRRQARGQGDAGPYVLIGCWPHRTGTSSVAGRAATHVVSRSFVDSMGSQQLRDVPIETLLSATGCDAYQSFHLNEGPCTGVL